MTNKLSKLTNTQLIDFIDNNLVWALRSQKSFYESLKEFHSKNDFLTPKQRFYLEKTALKIVSKKSSSHNFTEYRENLYKR